MSAVINIFKYVKMLFSTVFHVDFFISIILAWMMHGTNMMQTTTCLHSLLHTSAYYQTITEIIQINK